ncbi:hypothetical protein GCM10027276_34600 [Comamonas piscis]
MLVALMLPSTASYSFCKQVSHGKTCPNLLGTAAGMTCWRRLRNWNAAGVWEQLHQAMLSRLREHDQIDWSRASIDGSSVPSPRGARKQVLSQRTEASSAPSGTSS